MLKLGRKDPKQGRSKETVDAIFGAVTHILNKDGADHLTTNKIADVAGVSVGSLYQYFKNKESIYEGILLRLINEGLERLERILTEQKTDVVIRDIIGLIVSTQFESFQKMDKVSTVLLEYAPKVLPASHFKKADERIISFLIEQVKKHNVQIDPKNQEAAFFVCSQAVRGTMLMTFVSKKSDEREVIMSELIDMLTTYLEKKD
jgi:AcrR family transcriptional regulator